MLKQTNTIQSSNRSHCSMSIHYLLPLGLVCIPMKPCSSNHFCLMVHSHVKCVIVTQIQLFFDKAAGDNGMICLRLWRKFALLCVIKWKSVNDGIEYLFVRSLTGNCHHLKLNIQCGLRHKFEIHPNCFAWIIERKEKMRRPSRISLVQCLVVNYDKNDNLLFRVSVQRLRLNVSLRYSLL